MISKTKRIICTALIILGILSIIAACIGLGFPINNTFNQIPICVAGLLLGAVSALVGGVTLSF